MNGNITNAWVAGRVAELFERTDDDLLGQLVRRSASAGFDASELQVEAWLHELSILRIACASDALRESALLLEYPIPRRGKRIDAVLLTGNTAIVIEFKVGSKSSTRADCWQVEDYALDLRDFHRSSGELELKPLLVPTSRAGIASVISGEELDVTVAGSDSIHGVLHDFAIGVPLVDWMAWDSAKYDPTPTIIEATTKLFHSQSVDALNRSNADNLDQTVNKIKDLVTKARRDNCKLICFVTGVPGAGKTLAGLATAASLSTPSDTDARASFMSGNGPLVAVLREAIARDSKQRGLQTITSARRSATTLVQVVHEFIEEYGFRKPNESPSESTVVFDEAQRAWHAAKLQKRHPGATLSEPGVMLEIMSRRPGWCVLVALIGTGQEIHDGEAGLTEWIRSLESNHTDWKIAVAKQGIEHCASAIHEACFTPTGSLRNQVCDEPLCHLSVSLRSPRAEYLDRWINALLLCDFKTAIEEIAKIKGFRMAMTRSLSSARNWLQDCARDEMRPGLVASSRAVRLRPDGLEVHPDFLNAMQVEKWFLDGPDDFRSSHSLEIALTEFKVQGLELDFVGCCWSGDMIPDLSLCHWVPRKMYRTSWAVIKRPNDVQYAINKYRVLLSRAREGMIIWIPQGSENDPTRNPAELDRVAEAITRSGVPMI